MKLYLSPLIDHYKGEVVAYTLGLSATMKLVTGMLRPALAALPAGVKSVVHIDQGWRYQRFAYRSLLKTYGSKQSMSRRGNCLDNAVAENFFGHFKKQRENPRAVGRAKPRPIPGDGGSHLTEIA